MRGWVKTGINKTLDFKLSSSSSNNFYCTFLEDIENLFTKILMITDSFFLVIKFKIMLPITLVPIRPRHLKLNVTCYNICCLHGALEIGASQSKQKTRTLTLTEVWHSYYDPMRAQDSDRPDQSEASDKWWPWVISPVLTSVIAPCCVHLMASYGPIVPAFSSSRSPSELYWRCWHLACIEWEWPGEPVTKWR